MQNVIDWRMSLYASYCSPPVLHICLAKQKTGWFYLVRVSVESFMLVVAADCLTDSNMLQTADTSQNSMGQDPAIRNQVFDIAGYANRIINKNV